MKIFKSDFEKHYELGLACHNENKFDEAIKELKLASEIKPNDDGVYFALGNVYNVKGMQKEALDCYKKSLQLNPNCTKSKYMIKLLSNESATKSETNKNETMEEISSTYKLGVECAKKDMFEDAIMAWEKTLKLFPNFAKAYYNIGVANFKLNKIDEALRHLNQAKAFDPGYEEIYFCLGIIYYEQNKINEAIKEWEKAKEINPLNEKILCNLAVAYFELEKKSNKSITILQEVLKINPSYELARENLQKLVIHK
ncbi:tetratricopeptide repeat protein [Candidatus Desantisbacteria bacterium]|nr:tetratricopeptide repeat protein [Candidatus Desantisbacteria bacterium]